MGLITVLCISVALLFGYVVGWVLMVIAISPEVQRLRSDANRWRYVRDNATLAGETQDGVYLWEFEALDMAPDSIEADVDASIEADKGR